MSAGPPTKPPAHDLPAECTWPGASGLDAPGSLSGARALSSLAGVEVVEVSLVAYTAVLDLLRKLADAGEWQGDRCPLCNKIHDRGMWGHAEGCLLEHARTVRDALDYGDPQAQARALELLAPARARDPLDTDPDLEPREASR